VRNHRNVLGKTTDGPPLKWGFHSHRAKFPGSRNFKPRVYKTEGERGGSRKKTTTTGRKSDGVYKTKGEDTGKEGSV